ncbi:hypothetical protein BH23CHL10_BH23CHL10_13560 [soil metagenome]
MMPSPERVGVLVNLVILGLHRRHPDAKRLSEEDVRRAAAVIVFEELRGKPPVTEAPE